MKKAIDFLQPDFCSVHKQDHHMIWILVSFVLNNTLCRDFNTSQIEGYFLQILIWSIRIDFDK